MGDGNGRVAGPRCIALVGPFASGKTSLLEAILARTGAIPRQGKTADKNTVGDASAEARAHLMSVEANIAETDFMGDRFTFIDCPGSIEYAFEAEAVLAGADLAVVVAEADEKKIPALQVILKTLEDKKIPRVLFLNKMDKADGSVRDTLATLQPASTTPLVLRHIPIWQAGVVSGFIDLALERAFVYREHAPSEVIDLTNEEKAREATARYSMLEKLADYDDELMEQLLEDIPPPRDRVFSDLVQDLRMAKIMPVLIGSAEHQNGIGRLLKLIRHESPGIEQTCARLGLNPAAGETLLQVMKTFHTSHAGKLSIVRVLSGKVADGAELMGPKGPAGRVSGVLRVNGAQVVKREAGVAGETVGLGKLDAAPTGATLGTGKNPPPQPVKLV
ncbi:MAG: GTP-binding protein, partial [Bauldia sp.]|nr:GTP-binding protein [Bauldia sp.]